MRMLVGNTVSYISTYLILDYIEQFLDRGHVTHVWHVVTVAPRTLDKEKLRPKLGLQSLRWNQMHHSAALNDLLQAWPYRCRSTVDT